jgi:hypothetical protein
MRGLKFQQVRIELESLPLETIRQAEARRLPRGEAAAQASGPPPTHIGGPADQHGEQPSAMAMQEQPARDRRFHRVRR